MSNCSITWKTLVDYIDNKLSKSDSELLSLHLDSGCEHCRQQLDFIGRVNASLTSGDMTHAPKLQIDKAMAIFREQNRKPLKEHWLARLIYDSYSNLQPVAARGERTASRHRIYRADGYEIELWEDPLTDRDFYLIGQLLSTTSDKVHETCESIRLVNSQGHESTLTFEDHEFHAANVHAGAYELMIAFDGNILKVENLIVGA